MKKPRSSPKRRLSYEDIVGAQPRRPAAIDAPDVIAAKAELTHWSEIAHREGASDSDVQAACAEIVRICDDHDLWPEDYGIVRTYDRDDREDKEELATIEYYLNDGPRPSNVWMPYSLFWIGFHVISTSYMSGDPRCTPESSEIEASRYQRLVLRRARERYRQGYYADPFTKEPVLRPAKVAA